MRPSCSVLLDVARISERRNRALSCSGLLLTGDETYWQLLEGPDDAVQTLSRSILADSRHRVLWSRILPIADRKISTCLPLGYFDESEWRGHGPLLPDWGDRYRLDEDQAERQSRLLTALACEKYPSACMTNLTQLSRHRAPAQRDMTRQSNLANSAKQA